MTLVSFIRLDKKLLFQYTVIVLAFSIPLSIAAYTALSALLLVLWVIEGNWNEKWQLIRTQPFFKSIILFYLFIALSLLWSTDINHGLEHLRKYYILLLIPIIYTSFDRKWIPQIYSAFLAAMIISEILSYLIYFQLIPFKYKDSWSPLDPSPFMHHTIYSIFLIFSIFLMTIQLLHKQKTKFLMLIYSFFILTMTANLFINAGRTGQFSLLITLFIFLSIQFKLHWAKTLFAAIATSFILFTTAFFTSPNFHNRTLETYSSIDHFITEGSPLNDSTGLRFMMWKVAGDLIHDNPLLGVGIGDERNMYQKVLLKKSSELKNDISGFSDFHNTYLQITVEAGIVGLLMFCFVFYTLYKNLDTQHEFKLVGSIMLTLMLLYMSIGNFPAAYLTILFVLLTSITLKRPSSALFSDSIVK